MTLVKVNTRPKRAHYPSVFDHVFDNFINTPEWHAVPKSNKPLANVKENDEAFVIEFAIPGFDKNDVSINIEEEVLNVSGKKEESKEDQTWNRKEFSYDEFKRSFTLPENINTDDVSATFKNGILNITLPKQEIVKPEVKQIEIN